MDFHQNTQPDNKPEEQTEQMSVQNQITPESAADNANNNYNSNNSYNPNNSYYQNNNYNQNSNNGYPYYERSAYQRSYVDPGGSFATASMVLGIISIITSITFTVYPAFILGSIAIVLALLSKGRRPKLLSKAHVGIICAITGIVLNTIIVTTCTVLLFTSPEVRAEVNKTFEKQYGISFDEMWEEMMEENGF